jgi:ribonuclease P protein subunit RPR2
VRGGGRRGRRTGLMVRVARERIADLFALAEREAHDANVPLADRYVQLARRIGMRYNVRLLPEYAELYCRGCSSFWVEGTSVRTRLRGGLRVRTCLRCGRERRVPYRRPRRGVPDPATLRRVASAQAEVGMVGAVGPDQDDVSVPHDRDGR